MELSDTLLCLFSTDISSEDDRYIIEVPKQEIEDGQVDPSEVYRVAIISKRSESKQETGVESRTPTPRPSEPQPPVEVGEARYVEIEDIGKQGDGIARVERGYVIIVPNSEVGERVKVEISDVKPNFAVAEIIEETF